MLTRKDNTITRFDDTADSNINVNYGEQKIIQKIVDKSVRYQVDKKDTFFVEIASLWLIGKFGEKGVTIVGMITFLAGLAEILTFLNSLNKDTRIFFFLPVFSEQISTWILRTGIFFTVVGILLICILNYYKSSKCINCGKYHAYEEIGTPTAEEIPTHDGLVKIVKRSYKCKFCGHTEDKDYKEHIQKDPHSD